MYACVRVCCSRENMSRFMDSNKLKFQCSLRLTLLFHINYCSWGLLSIYCRAYKLFHECRVGKEADPLPFPFPSLSSFSPLLPQHTGWFSVFGTLCIAFQFVHSITRTFTMYVVLPCDLLRDFFPQFYYSGGFFIICIWCVSLSLSTKIHHVVSVEYSKRIELSWIVEAKDLPKQWL